MQINVMTEHEDECWQVQEEDSAFSALCRPEERKHILKNFKREAEGHITS